MANEMIHTIAMNVSGRRSVRCAFIENTIPTKRSHAININVRILETRDSTVDHAHDKTLSVGY